MSDMTEEVRECNYCTNPVMVRKDGTQMTICADHWEIIYGSE